MATIANIGGHLSHEKMLALINQLRQCVADLEERTIELEGQIAYLDRSQHHVDSDNEILNDNPIHRTQQ